MHKNRKIDGGNNKLSQYLNTDLVIMATSGITAIIFDHREEISIAGGVNIDALFENDQLNRIIDYLPGIEKDCLLGNIHVKMDRLLKKPRYTDGPNRDYYCVFVACISHNITMLQLCLDYIKSNQHTYPAHDIKLAITLVGEYSCFTEDFDALVLVLEKFEEYISGRMLVIACIISDLEMVKYLIENYRDALEGAAVDALLNTCFDDDTDIIQVLIDNYYDIIYNSPKGCIKSFNQACMLGHIATVKILVTTFREKLDFKKNRDYSFDRNRLFSCDRWCVRERPRDIFQVVKYLNETYGTSIWCHKTPDHDTARFAGGGRMGRNIMICLSQRLQPITVTSDSYWLVLVSLNHNFSIKPCH